MKGLQTSIFSAKDEVKSTLHLFFLRKSAEIYIAAKPFQPKGTVLLRNRVVIVIPRGREPARCYLRCLKKHSKFTSLHTGCLVAIGEPKPFLDYLQCFKLYCYEQKIWEKEQNTRECIKYSCFVFIFAMCALEEEGRTSFKHSWCVCHVLLFKRILVVYKTV